MTDFEYTQIYQSERKGILALVKAILGRDYARDAEDVVQDVFKDLWKKRDSIAKPLEWIKSAARHEAVRVRELGQRYDQWGMPIELERIAGVAQ